MSSEESNENSMDQIEIIYHQAPTFSNHFDYDEEEEDEEEEGVKPQMELPDVSPIQPIFDAPPVISDTMMNFRPPNWKGLMAVIQNEPVDLCQLGKDIFEETQGSEARYKCILNGLQDKSFRLDLPTLYQRRADLVKRLNGDNDFMVQLYDFNMGCIAKMDLERKAFNNIVDIHNQNVFYNAVNSGKIPEQYKFNPNHMDEVIFFTPVEVDEYRSTDSVKILNSVVELRLTNQEEIVRQIAFKTYTSCVNPENLGQMSPIVMEGKKVLMKEFFTFLKRTLYQSFGLPYRKFMNSSLESLVSDLSTDDYPYENATAAILLKLSTETVKNTCHAYSLIIEERELEAEIEARIPQQSKPGRRGRKRRRLSDESEELSE